MINKNTKEYIESKKAEGLYGLSFDIVEHPGLTLKDEIEHLGISQSQFAVKVGCTEQTISRIVNEKEPISSEMAVRFETVFGGHPSAQFWNSMQNSYDLSQLKNELVLQAEKEIGFFDANLTNVFSELKHYGFIENIIARGKEAKIQAILAIKKFFGTSNFPSILAEDNMQVVFRQYKRNVKDDYAVAGWVRAGTREALKRFSVEGGIPEYDMKKFMEKIVTLKVLSRESQEVFLERLKVELFECGVLVVYLPGFKNTHIGGALKWIKSHPVIMLKTYKQWEDTFWFNLFHEIGHIIKHSKKDFFMDFGEENAVDEKEKEADTFAKEMLLPPLNTIINDLKLLKTTDWNAKLESVAKKNNVSVGILVGRLCKDLEKDERVWKMLGGYRKTIKEMVI